MLPSAEIQRITGRLRWLAKAHEEKAQMYERHNAAMAACESRNISLGILQACSWFERFGGAVGSAFASLSEDLDNETRACFAMISDEEDELLAMARFEKEKQTRNLGEQNGQEHS